MRRLVACAAILLLAGCTDVPQGSSPTVIQSRVLAPQLPPPDPPPRNAPPREIVTAFLDLNGKNDPNHQDARQYLTPAASTRWSDARVTVLNQPTVGTVGRDGTVEVTGNKLGTVDAAGVYRPELSGNGTGGTSVDPVTFTVKKVSGQWRIDKLPSGLLVNPTQFRGKFQQRVLYFYDLGERALVPDPRYTQLTDPSSLATWLLRALAAGPRDPVSVTGAQVSELPNQTDVSRLTVTVGDNASQPVTITIPGAADTDRVRLAIELAKTFAQVPGIGTTRALRILDGTDPVRIPRLGATFTASDYAAIISPFEELPQLYYVDAGGGVRDSVGTRLPGRVGDGYYDLTSVALQTGAGGDGLRIAGVRLDDGVQTVDVGTESDPLKPVDKVRGTLSRPDWAPDQPEFWIGAGSTLYRVSSSGEATVVRVSTASGPAQGTVRAVRFSPDGGRVALVLSTTGSGGAPLSQVWIGAVARSGGATRVEGLYPITPTGVAVTDVAWNDELKLFGIGRDLTSGPLPGIYELQCDGSLWSPRTTGILPGEPQTITVADGQDAAVSVGDTVWKQLRDTWESLYGDADVAGRAPIYVR